MIAKTAATDESVCIRERSASPVWAATGTATSVLPGGRIIGIDPDNASQPGRSLHSWEIRTRASPAALQRLPDEPRDLPWPAQAVPGFGGLGIE
jgi:hypothetical protein